MGWSFSPFIAQSISMGLILHTLKRCGIDVTEYQDLPSPPPMIKVFREGRLIAVGAVWYDNILFCSTDAQLALRFFQILS